MKTKEHDKKDSRLDLRMTKDQREQIDIAASINGMSVSQWSINCLMDSARRDIAEQSIVRLASDQFAAFASLLEERPTPAFDAFRRETTRWER